MGLLNKKGWKKLRLARISITLNTIKDLKLKKAVAKDIIKQIDTYMDLQGLKAKSIPDYNLIERNDVPYELFMESKKQYLLGNNKKYLLDKIEAYDSKQDYRFKWLGEESQLETLFDIYFNNKCIVKTATVEEWLSNFLSKEGKPFNDNGITKIVWIQSNVYLARTINHLMSKQGGISLIYEKKNKWVQTNKLFCDIDRKPFIDLAKSLNQQKENGEFIRNKKNDPKLDNILHQINSL